MNVFLLESKIKIAAYRSSPLTMLVLFGIEDQLYRPRDDDKGLDFPKLRLKRMWVA